MCKLGKRISVIDSLVVQREETKEALCCMPVDHSSLFGLCPTLKALLFLGTVLLFLSLLFKPSKPMNVCSPKGALIVLFYTKR
jgi:hypothetical protein